MTKLSERILRRFDDEFGQASGKTPAAVKLRNRITAFVAREIDGIRDELVARADKGEFEGMRREVEKVFNP